MAIFVYSLMEAAKNADPKINTIKMSGMRMVINKNLLLLTLVMYSLCIMSETLFMLLFVKLFEIVCFLVCPEPVR